MGSHDFMGHIAQFNSAHTSREMNEYNFEEDEVGEVDTDACQLDAVRRQNIFVQSLHVCLYLSLFIWLCKYGLRH